LSITVDGILNVTVCDARGADTEAVHPIPTGFLPAGHDGSTLMDTWLFPAFVPGSDVTVTTW
jgi:hypothetical protein